MIPKGVICGDIRWRGQRQEYQCRHGFYCKIERPGLGRPVAVVRAKAETTEIDLAARCARSFARKPCPLKSEGAGKTGCALHPRSHVRCVLKMLHMSIQGSGEHPTFPAQWLYGLYEIVLVTGFLATIIRSKR